MVRPLTGYVYSGIWQSSDHSGSIMIEFDPEGAVSMFHYFIIPNENVKHVEIISEEAAYSELMDGNFEQYPPFEKGGKIVIQDCVLSYTYDTKAFFDRLTVSAGISARRITVGKPILTL